MNNFSYDKAVLKVKSILDRLNSDGNSQREMLEMIREANSLIEICFKEFKRLEEELKDRVEKCL